MGRKKTSARDEESAPVGGGKSKKKAFVINDDEYSIGTDLSEDPPEEKVVTPVNNKKGKKGGVKKEEDEEVDDIKFGEVDEDEDEPVMKFSGKKKSKGKKGGNNNSFSSSAFGLLGEDEEEGGGDDKNDDDEEEDEEVVRQTVIAFSGKKKSSKDKKTTGKVSSAFDLLQEEEESEEEEDDISDPVVAFSGKKKALKSKKSGGTASSAFDLLQEEEDGEENVASPKEYEDEDVPVSFTGKKKKKSSKTSGNAFSAALLDEENDDDASVSKIGDDLKDGTKDEEGDLSALNFSGKKKSSKKKNANANAASEIGNAHGSSDFMESHQLPAESKTENPTIDNAESSKNKKKKKKGGKGVQEEEEEDLDKILAELGEAPSVSKPAAASLSVPDVPPNEPELQEAVGDKEDKEEEPLESVKNAAKNKKKKKKGGKTAQDEEDLDKILTEIASAPPVTEPAPSSVEAPTELEEAVGDKEAEDEGLAESAAAKKRKKKKGKDKKAAVEEKQEETKAEISNKISDKKVPKHVREMQERLAKLKEAEEKKKREEEERLRKEEEERLRLEELERQAEEKKRLKKEKEKEKLLKKKQEGKLLTGKQKEEARRLEAMRNQILAAGGLQIPTGEATSKRPLYQKKKPKPQAQSNGSTVVDASPADVIESSDSIEATQEVAPEISSVEPENVQETAPLSEKDLLDTVDVVKENGVAEEEDDDDEDWDAKSWDDADLKLPGKGTFSDEEVDSEPEPLPKKELKVARPATTKDVEPPSKATKPAGLNEKVASTVPRIPEKVTERKSKDIEPEVARKNDDKAPVVPDNKLSNSQNGQSLRSPICCIMGHVDTGKTKLLDCIRGTNVQEGEAGGITQQIGATYFPAENIRERTKELKADAKLNVPGLLVIDTPGHESFTNLRSRGSGLCDIAILVVDIMHGLEPQTIESLNLLKMRNTEFIVALNKVDRLYGWKTCRNAPITKTMKQQSKDVQIEFNMRLTQVITQFKEQGLNTELYYKNKEMGETFSIVPTSAISGEGIPDLLLLLVQWAQKTMISRLTYSDEVQCTVLEVKVVEGHGTTIDVVLVNGVLHEGDQIIVCGLQGPIVTTIRALLTPHPMKELRVKGSFLHHKEIKAAMGIKITAQGLEHAIAGTSLYVVKPGDDLEEIKETAMEDMKSVMNRIDKSGEGVYVQASTLGSLEALLEFLKSPAVSIPVSGISIGPVHKKDVMKASVMLEKRKEYGTILAFDVKVTQEARDLAEELGVKIFIADIIYHLFDQFKAYIDNLKEEKKKQASEEAVFPCVLKIIPNCVFNTKDPIVLGVDVLDGIAKVGTPICVPQKDFIDIGRIASIENNHKPVDYAKKGQKVAIKIIGSNPEEQQKMFGRHFEIEDELVSKISRSSLDALKEHYRDDLSVDEKRLLFKLKILFKIP